MIIKLRHARNLKMLTASNVNLLNFLNFLTPKRVFILIKSFIMLICTFFDFIQFIEPYTSPSFTCFKLLIYLIDTIKLMNDYKKNKTRINVRIIIN